MRSTYFSVYMYIYTYIFVCVHVNTVHYLSTPSMYNLAKSKSKSKVKIVYLRNVQLQRTFKKNDKDRGKIFYGQEPQSGESILPQNVWSIIKYLQ